MQNSEVVSPYASSTIPGGHPGTFVGRVRRLGQREDEQNSYYVIVMNGTFISGFGLQVINRRSLSDNVAGERRNVLLNEAASRLLGFEKPEETIQDRIFLWGDTLTVVDIVKNYHQESLKRAFDPLIVSICQDPHWFLLY